LWVAGLELCRRRALDSARGPGEVKAPTAMLIGRDVERAHLEQLLDAVASGPVGCILEGVPGIGKTTVWREAVESARRRGYQVLDTAPSEPESTLAFSGLGDLFERLSDEALGLLPEAQADALRAALFLGDVPEGSRGTQAIPRAVLGVLRHLSDAGPAVIAIDDEQWLDPASARVLAFALCRLRDEPVVAIIARRPVPASALSAELRRRYGTSSLETVSLQPLPMGAIKTLLESRLQRTIPRPLLGRIHQASGGNPLYALAIALEIEARHTSGDRAGELPVPRTLSDAIELRLEHLDPGAHAAMLAIAALSQPTLAMLQAAIPDFALSDLESAERAGVLEISGGRVRFTHPLLASTHYANTPASKRRELHRRLATVIDDEEERAQHAALGAEAPDRDLADTLEKAAGVAARRGATESAAQLLEDAARLTPLDQETARSERIVAAAEHRFISGEVSRAREMLEDVIPDLAPGSLRARARLALALLVGEEPTVVMSLLESALADAGEDDKWRVEIESELTAVACDVGLLAAARAHGESAVATAQRLEDPDLITKALGHLLVTFVCTGHRMPGDVLARLSAAEDSVSITAYHQPSTSIGLALFWAGDFEAARPLLERAAQRALSRGEEWDRLGVLLALANLEWETGNQDLARQHRRAAEDALGEFAEAFLWLVDLDVKYALETGDLEVARTKAEHGLALAKRTGSMLHDSRMMLHLAEFEMLSGQPDRAHARLEDHRSNLEASGWGPAGYFKARVWWRDTEALITLGRLEEAEQLLADFRRRAQVCESSHLRALASRYGGLLLAARGDLASAIDAMDDALAAHAERPRPYEHGRTLLEKGSIERRAKRKAAAKQTLEEALTILGPIEAQIWISRARDELSRIGLRRSRATEGLTPAQSRVGELVAAGLTNQEIARTLHMSLRTVESHLSRVFREHGVSSRSQLVATLLSSGGAPPIADDQAVAPLIKGDR
jgi:DNA-binding CsgD family transcriptional regulator